MSEQLSLRMIEVLVWTAEAGDRVRFDRLVAQRVDRGQSESVARASLSRTVRRLWRRGLVELNANRPWLCATAKSNQAAERLEQLKNDPPEDTYQSYLQWRYGFRAFRGEPAPDDLAELDGVYGSAEAFLESTIRAFEKRIQHPERLYVRVVDLTVNGWERLVKSVGDAELNRISELRDAQRKHHLAEWEWERRYVDEHMNGRLS